MVFKYLSWSRKLRKLINRMGTPHEELPPGYQEVKYHMIFDIKMGKNFQRKAHREIYYRKPIHIDLCLCGIQGHCKDSIDYCSA
eukprot:14385269-Ditylum_brightwellii.AAC.1